MDNDAWSRFKSHKPNPKPVSAPQNSRRRAPLLNPKAESEDIFTMWEDQKRMKREDNKLAEELRETKKKAKELSRTLRKHQFGEVKSDFSVKTKKYASSTKKSSEKVIKSIESKKSFRKGKNWIVGHKKYTSVIAVSLILVSSFLIFKSTKSDTTQTLGESVTTGINSADTTNTDGELSRETPSFVMLYPVGTSSEDYDIVRISPKGNAPSYTFIDHLNGVEDTFQLTQQEIPKDFNLDKAAETFQATNVIQIDENKVYHGYSEKTGTQSLLFVKDGKFVLIASPKKFSDEQWASYIISLK